MDYMTHLEYVEITYWSKLLNDATIFSDQILLLRVYLYVCKIALNLKKH